MKKNLEQAALEYHALPTPGKIRIEPTKPCTTQEELALAYTPGVAEPVRAITRNPDAVYRYTNKSNLVAVITDGSAVLGLGKAGPLAAKPVMEGKAILFKNFAGIDVFDIEVDAPSTQAFIETVANIAPTFGGINLEDIRAPECFEIEKALIERLDIPVFHDDQHGTAIVIAAGLLNALELQRKKLDDVSIVCLGAGSAGIASINLLIALGAKRERILLVDTKGVVEDTRTDLSSFKQAFSQKTDRRTLADAMRGADVFIGVAAADLLTPDMVRAMAPRPIVFALANPDPEILPEAAHAARNDLIMATGRSDYPNQINNALGFPYIFRGALDVRARCINPAMCAAAVRALAELARAPVPKEVLHAYRLDRLAFGPDYIVPKPFDPRLLRAISSAVAQAAVTSGVARAQYPAHYSRYGT
ncbi:MAG: malic enzyme-like NAD(P)-binding protein [Sulfurifustaceae bacterium]